MPVRERSSSVSSVDALGGVRQRFTPREWPVGSVVSITFVVLLATLGLQGRTLRRVGHDRLQRGGPHPRAPQEGTRRCQIPYRFGDIRRAPRPHRPSLRGEISLARLSFERGSQMVTLYRNWPAALADRIGFRRRDRRVIYRLRALGGRVELLARTNGADVRTINEVWIGEFYARFVDQIGARDRQIVIVDIGANCGYFAVYAGRKFPGARIVCFEPEAENLSLARTNLALNGLDADLHAQAVVPKRADTITLNLSNDPRLHTTVAVELAEAHGIDKERYDGRALEVSAVEVNEALAPLALDGRIDLVKMDVEGLELALLEALDDVILASISCISAEVGDRDTAVVTERLQRNGFRVTHDAGLLLATHASEKDRDR